MNPHLTARGQDMGDTLRTRHRLHFWFLPIAAPVLIKGRTHRASIDLVQMSNQQIYKSDRVNARPEFAQSHRMTDECFADKSFASSPTDLAVAANLANLIVLWISDFGQTRRECSLIFAVPFGRHGLSQGFVGTQTIVTAQPGCRAMLLPAPGASRRLSSFLLHHSMELFVCAIVLGAGWSGKFDTNAQPHPPGTQLRKARRPLRGKGTAIVDPDYLGHALLPEKPSKCGPDRPQVLRWQCSYQQAISTEQISHCQRFAALAIACSKPAFDMVCRNLFLLGDVLKWQWTNQLTKGRSRWWNEWRSWG